MFKFLTQGTKIMRMRSGIIAIATLAVLAAVITTLTLSSFTAEAQGNSGAVANLQLNSTSAGELTVSWDAASPTPTDYRVDWAKSTEDYQSWKVDEGHVYPTPDATTTTITDLSHDTEYKIRMRARYYRGEHEGKSWGGPWATATITVAGEPAETPTPEPVKEEPVQQPPRDAPDPPAGTIDTLTAADETGQLLLTWEAPAAPNADPTDYHVNWAKSAEDYPADTASAGNDHPTTTTHTLAGLDYATDYNVRVRARYTDGENAASPWNGPWTETTAQVLQPLPAAPIMGGTAVTPNSQVLLTWFNIDEDDSITGYQILRGPKADSLVIIEDDTGSSSTSYTDETPPAGQTHTYAVKARNASGLSPLSNTLTATVPAAEVEEELVTARHESTDNTLVSNVGQPIVSGAGVVSGASAGIDYEQAIRFTTGANPNGYHLTGVQLYLQEVLPGLIPNPMVSIRGDNEGLPGETVLASLTTTTAITGSWNLVTFATSDQTTLQPNTRYWLHVTASTFPMTTQLAASSNEDAASNVGWRISDGWYGRRDGLAWTEYPNARLRIAIHGHHAPEFLVSNLDESPSTSQTIHVQTVAATANLAQSFRADNNPDGSSTEFDFHGITLLLKGPGDAPRELTASELLVTVHSDTSGQPGDLVYTLTPPSSPYTVLGDGGPVPFMAPTGSTLSSGVTYWLKLEAAAASVHFRVSYIWIGRADVSDEVQGPTTENRWYIGDSSLKSRQVLAWEPLISPLKISVLGSQRFETLVSNIDQPTLPLTLFVGPGYESAQSFHIPSGPLGQQYRLSSVRIIASSENPTHASVDLHADHNGTPGSHLASLTTPGDFAPGLSVKADFIAVAPRGTLLNTDTRYWIVFRNEQNLAYFDIQTTLSKTEDLPSLDGWTIGNRKVSKFPNQPWATTIYPIKMELLGTPFIRTNESDGPDLPGAGHNAHKTTAVVTPGIVSTGHLTPGLDRNHGLYGDYWWLDTQWGHSYRIEVKFGDSPNTATGGSAWTYFIDGDRRGTCCDSDHNRNDGYTILHIKHDQNRKYLIDVVVFDKLNSGSKNFNGPYTITMTDITGTDKLVSNLYIGTLTKVANYVGSNRQYASSFTAGHNPGGYKLDRIRTHIPDDHSSPVLALHTDTSFAPGAKLCDFRNPTQVQHLVYWEDFPAPIPFTAPDCTDVTLAANGKYWIVFAGTGYKPVVTDSGGELTKEGGWSIGNTALTKTTGTWGDLTGGIIAAEIWASPR